jgi:hypothetical protein
VPRWYTGAELDIFVHWGLYSIPPSPKPDHDFTAYMRELTAGRGARGRSPYAEPFDSNAANVDFADCPPEPARGTWSSECSIDVAR